MFDLLPRRDLPPRAEIGSQRCHRHRRTVIAVVDTFIITIATVNITFFNEDHVLLMKSMIVLYEITCQRIEEYSKSESLQLRN